jgi:hypothetical protein
VTDRLEHDQLMLDAGFCQFRVELLRLIAIDGRVGSAVADQASAACLW